MTRWYFKQIDKIDKVEVLRRLPLFSGLQEPELRLLANEMRLIEYKKGDFIYREGDPADCFYAIVSGRVKVFSQEEQREKIFAYLYEGDYFGELSLLTGEPHSVNVVVQNDALLLRLGKESFNQIIQRSPQVTIQISRVLSNRLKRKDREGERIKESKIISIYSVVPQAGKTSFAINLAGSLTLETRRKTIVIDFNGEGDTIHTLLKLEMKNNFDLKKVGSAEGEIVQKYVTTHPSGFHLLGLTLHEFKEGDERKITALLSHLAFSYDFILLDLPTRNDVLTQNILTQSDLIYLMTDAPREHLLQTKEVLDSSLQHKEIRDKIRIILNEKKPEHRASLLRKEEMLGEKINQVLPYTQTLQDYIQLKGIPFVIGSPTSHYSKMVRYMAREIGDVLVGLALGSGAALGLAHVGVLKVLEKEKIPIDVVAGTSMGAIVAAVWASGKKPDEMEKIAERFSSRARTFSLFADFNFLWTRGFFKGVKVSGFLKNLLGSRTFQDASFPLKVVAVDLNTREELILDKGLLFEAVRASMSIPGIVEPILRDGQTIVDGAVVSPVPIETLRRCGANKIIAVNVLPSPQAVLERRKRLEETEEKKMAAVLKKNFFIRSLYRLRKKLRRVFIPNIFDIMMQSMQTMEYEISEIACRNADVVIRPTTISASWFEFFEAKKFIRRGEEETLKHLPEIKQLVWGP
ncbi:MAG: patatin-like phospholipase family protein [Candidatus Omnitrophica bacterium]|nr:patatin-like phospholipase family protein [Candidatus Omnitrophota bacterium]